MNAPALSDLPLDELLEMLDTASADPVSDASPDRLDTLFVREVDGDRVTGVLLDGTTVTLPTSELPPARPAVGDRRTLARITRAGETIHTAAVPQLVTGLFGDVTPEIADGTVRIMRVARLAGVRTKVAVATTHPDIDPVVTCVGPGANRVQAVVRRLGGEQVDVVAWHPDRHTAVANALAPTQVKAVADVTDGVVVVATPAHQMAATVGEGGANTILAGLLCDVRILVCDSPDAMQATADRYLARTAPPANDPAGPDQTDG